ncbi:AN1-type zinc finger protein 2B-like [Ptychodera flava]|uniref:AN1-type zinc finger protein 2B-like n=1 Tax=Ptychodera flava TaxID=63121 RepID=UPI00396AA602
MEFPDLGKHCCEPTCKQLDFLPMKCDSCQQIFCKDHITYKSHNCESSYRKDVQVPVCPLCNQPVPVTRGEPPDIKVSDHIDRDCQSDPAKKKRKAYANKCSVKGCKQRELIPVVCDSCRLNFCLKHRHQQDHKCEGFQGSGRLVSSAGAAAIKRAQMGNSSGQLRKAGLAMHTGKQSPSIKPADLDRERREREQRRTHQVNTVYSLQAGMSEDEAMSRALQMSLADSEKNNHVRNSTRADSSSLQEEEDLALAQALAASEEEERQRQRQRHRQQHQPKDSSCSLA